MIPSAYTPEDVAGLDKLSASVLILTASHAFTYVTAWPH